MTKLRCIVLLLLLSAFLRAQDKKGNVITDANDAARMVVARQKLYAGKYVEALNAFREVEQNNPKDAAVKHYVGLCYFNLKQYANAKETLLKARELNIGVKPETHLLLGKIYQIEENFDKAIEEFNLYQSSPADDKEAREDAGVLLSQCRNAQDLMSRPLEVTVNNLGEGINSKYDDKNPCITADGTQLIFTTRRPETTSSAVDIEGDGKYFENIYLAAADSGSREFTRAAGVSKSVNTPAHDACTSISPDGKQIFIYKNDASSKASRGGNVFVSKITNGKWRVPESLGKPINSSYWEGGACVSPDGKTYFFTSEREGGFGNSDIWMVKRIGKNEWGKPENLGPEVNTAYDEAGMFLAPDGKTLFFCSNGPGSMGSYDVFKTVLENGQWSKPVNLGYPINTAAREGQLTVSADARFAYISSDRKGGLGESDIYKIDLRDFAILEKDGKRSGNGLSILKGTLREGFEGYGIADAEVTVKNESTGETQSTLSSDNGEYFFMMKGGKYQLSIRKKGYQEISESIELPVAEKDTPVLEKGYLLKK